MPCQNIRNRWYTAAGWSAKRCKRGMGVPKRTIRHRRELLTDRTESFAILSICRTEPMHLDALRPPPTPSPGQLGLVEDSFRLAGDRVYGANFNISFSTWEVSENVWYSIHTRTCTSRQDSSLKTSSIRTPSHVLWTSLFVTSHQHQVFPLQTFMDTYWCKALYLQTKSPNSANVGGNAHDHKHDSSNPDFACVHSLSWRAPRRALALGWNPKAASCNRNPYSWKLKFKNNNNKYDMLKSFLL